MVFRPLYGRELTVASIASPGRRLGTVCHRDLLEGPGTCTPVLETASYVHARGDAVASLSGRTRHPGERVSPNRRRLPRTVSAVLLSSLPRMKGSTGRKAHEPRMKRSVCWGEILPAKSGRTRAFLREPSGDIRHLYGAVEGTGGPGNAKITDRGIHRDIQGYFRTTTS